MDFLGFPPVFASLPQGTADEATKYLDDYNTFPYLGKLAGLVLGAFGSAKIYIPRSARRLAARFRRLARVLGWSGPKVRCREAKAFL